MVAEANYGGRVTDPMDRRLIKIILKQFYSSTIIEDNFTLSQSGAYKVLDDPTFESCLEYIKTFPMNDLTEVFGLHNNA
jgi:dynein heavy chain